MAKPASVKLNPILSQLLNENYLMMVEVVGRKTYLLMKHYRYLNPVKEAKRVLIARNPLMADGVHYLS